MKNETITIRISEKDKQTLKALAEQNQMTMSEYLVHLIRIEGAKNK